MDDVLDLSDEAIGEYIYDDCRHEVVSCNSLNSERVEIGKDTTSSRTKDLRCGTTFTYGYPVNPVWPITLSSTC